MPPRQGQLDEISEAIGRLNGQIEGIDRYIHEREHNIANLSQKVDGIGALISREVARLKGELQGDLTSLRSDIDKLSDRVRAVEEVQHQQAGAKNLATWLLRSPLIGWLVAAALFAAAWWRGELPR